MSLVPREKGGEAEHRRGQRRGGHQDGLHPSRQRGVRFHEAAVLRVRGGADAAQLAPRERRLEEVGGVHAALGGARADQEVELVDEQHHLPVGGLHLPEHALQPLLKCPPEVRARHQAPQVEGHHTKAPKRTRRAIGGKKRRDPLGHGGLAHPRLSDEERVVLGPAQEHLQGALYDPLTADHRVQAPLLGFYAQVDAVPSKKRAALLLAPCVLPRGLAEGPWGLPLPLPRTQGRRAIVCPLPTATGQGQAPRPPLPPDQERAKGGAVKHLV
mmetsp:Transcript_51043/g.163314  ORF Transcript_51043/g.163314 Transcript_51043/m.163314 type:complete len:271 (+) Transcript_51043:497-1309(+)